jgi:O-antigen/teichoic acid export membrane protein
LALAYTITNIPVNSFGQAISQYVISETGKSTELDKLYLLLKKIMLILFLLAIPFFLHINEISLWVLTTFFDEKWLESHHYIVILAFLGFLKIITMSVINICNIINFQQFQLYLNSSLLIVSVCIAIYSTSANQFINFFVVSNILILIMGISYLMIFLKRVKDEKNIVCW